MSGQWLAYSIFGISELGVFELSPKDVLHPAFHRGYSARVSRELCQQFIHLRQQSPAWLLLASSKAPLTAYCLKTILDAKPIGVPWDDAVEMLAEIFEDHVNNSDYGLDQEADQSRAALREMRKWVRLGLVVEREGQLIATDGLERALSFLGELEQRTMTSTASRLATVQREIENIEAKLNPHQESRIASLRERIGDLEKELGAAERGEFEVLAGPQAEEGIREVYQLALSLRADFRRVEDSYREADRRLRQRILGEGQNRGDIVDSLLDSHDDLVKTPEGQVFESFHEQLVKPLELDRMKARLRAILANEAVETSLERRQRLELRSLVPSLVAESQGVIQARARSERDVRSFLKSGLGDEQLRVGALLQEVLRVACEVDWTSQKTRRSPSPMPPVAVANPNLKLIERLTFRENVAEAEADLDLSERSSDLGELGQDFWMAFQALDRSELFFKTLAHLQASERALTLKELAEALPPTHDLETLSYWLAMAREAGVPMGEEGEEIDLQDESDGWFRFLVPSASLSFSDAQNLNSETLG